MDQLNTIASIPGIQRRVRDNRLVNKRAKDGRLVTAEQQAQDPRYGYVLGQLRMDRRINDMQHATGLRYADDMVNYLALSGLKLPSARAQNLFSGREHPPEETEDGAEAAKKARARAKAILNILQDTGNIDQGRRVESAVKSVCLMDIEEARHWSEAQLDHLRLGLNALARKCYGLERAS